MWHAFYCVANAFCSCRYGTNDPKFELLAKQGWGRVCHQDIKADNVLMSAPGNECHRLYIATYWPTSVKASSFILILQDGLGFFTRSDMQYRKNRNR